MLSFNPIIRKSQKARNLTVKITHDASVIVTVPHFISNTEVHRLLNQKHDWIMDKLNHRRQNRESISLADGNLLSLFGTPHTIEKLASKIPKPKIFIANSKLLIFASPSTKEDVLTKYIIATLKKYFRKELTNLINTINVDKKFKYNRIAIKDNSSNWGSCSSKNNLNFNWRLLFAPYEIIRYVAVHELCHLIEHNHSNAFWDLVRNWDVDYKIHRAWLRQNGNNLYIRPS